MIFSITGSEESLQKIEYPEGITFQKIPLELSLLAHQRTNEMPVWRKKVLQAIHEERTIVFLCPNATPEELTELTRSIRALSHDEPQILFTTDPNLFERYDQVNAIYSPQKIIQYITEIFV